MNILVTGAAGFIGFNVSSLLLKKNFNIYGVDNLNNYYDVNLKLSRLKILKNEKNFHFKKIDIKNYKILLRRFFFQPLVLIQNFLNCGLKYSSHVFSLNLNRFCFNKCISQSFLQRHFDLCLKLFNFIFC